MVAVMALTVFFYLSLGNTTYNTSMKIDNDGSVTYSERIRVSDELLQANGEDKLFSDEEIKEYRKHGIMVEEINDDGKTGVILTKHFESINDISTEADTSCELNLAKGKISDQYCFKKEKGFFFTTYKAKISNKDIKDNIQYKSVDNDDKYIDINEYRKSTNVLYEVSLPYEVIDSNANNRTSDFLQWDIVKNNNIDYYEFSFKVPNIFNIVIAIIGAGTVGFLTIAVIISLIINRPKKEKVTTEVKLETLEEAQENPMVNQLLAPDESENEPIPQIEEEPLTPEESENDDYKYE